MTDLIYATTELRANRELGKNVPLSDLPMIVEREGMTVATQETFWVVAYDAMTYLRAIIEVARGDYFRVEVSIPAVLNAVLISGCNRFYVMHNHPSGGKSVKPTAKDIELTKQIMLAAAICGVFLEDHVVIGPDAIWSMREHGQLTPSSAITAMYAANGPVFTHEGPK